MVDIVIFIIRILCYLLIILGFALLIYGVIVTEPFEKNIYEKYKCYVLDKKQALAIGFCSVFWLLSLLIPVLDIIGTVLIIWMYNRTLILCFNRCVAAGLNKKEVSKALFLQLILPLLQVIFVVGIADFHANKKYKNE